MLDCLLPVGALLLAGALLWPPRGARRRWLLAAGALLWAGLMAGGAWRGVAPGFWPWLALLSLVGALVGLLVVWSLVYLLGTPRAPRPDDAPTDDPPSD